jgi:hypothetical protein
MRSASSVPREHVAARRADDHGRTGRRRADQRTGCGEHCKCLELHAFSFPRTHAFTDM